MLRWLETVDGLTGAEGAAVRDLFIHDNDNNNNDNNDNDNESCGSRSHSRARSW